MKAITTYFTIFLVLVIAPCSLVAQLTVTKSAAASATIVEPATVPKTVNSEYGNVSLVLTALVQMTPVGKQSKKWGIVLPVPSGTFTATIYNFTGSEGCTYSFAYPKAPMIIRNGSDALEVASFTSVRNSDSELIAGVFVSVTPASVIVNYN
jgi:hypothetical protein